MSVEGREARERDQSSGLDAGTRPVPRKGKGSKCQGCKAAKLLGPLKEDAELQKKREEDKKIKHEGAERGVSMQYIREAELDARSTFMFNADLWFPVWSGTLYSPSVPCYLCSLSLVWSGLVHVIALAALGLIMHALCRWRPASTDMDWLALNWVTQVWWQQLASGCWQLALGP